MHSVPYARKFQKHSRGYKTCCLQIGISCVFVPFPAVDAYASSRKPNDAVSLDAV